MIDPFPDPGALIQGVREIRNTNDLGQSARAQRRAQGLRIDDAAALIGVSVDLLSRLENGQGGVRTDKLLAVLDGLGLTLVVAPKGHPGLKKFLQEPPNSARGSNHLG